LEIEKGGEEETRKKPEGREGRKIGGRVEQGVGGIPSTTREKSPKEGKKKDGVGVRSPSGFQEIEATEGFKESSLEEVEIEATWRATRCGGKKAWDVQSEELHFCRRGTRNRKKGSGKKKTAQGMRWKGEGL